MGRRLHYQCNSGPLYHVEYQPVGFAGHRRCTLIDSTVCFWLFIFSWHLEFRTLNELCKVQSFQESCQHYLSQYNFCLGVHILYTFLSLLMLIYMFCVAFGKLVLATVLEKILSWEKAAPWMLSALSFWCTNAKLTTNTFWKSFNDGDRKSVV